MTRGGPPLGVVFDLFGTLVTKGLGPSAYRSLATKLPGGRLSEAYRLALTSDIPTVSEFIARFPELNEIDATAHEDQLLRDLAAVDLFPETLEVLRELRGLGVKVGVLSNLAAPYREPFFRLGLDAEVDLWVFSCEVGRMKPEREIFEHSAQRMGLPPAQLLMVGDSRHDDILGARGAGIDALHVRGGQGSANDLRAVLARFREPRPLD